jgi:hypothetical protein
MQEQNLTELESLRIIEQMINKAKSHFSEDGHLYLLWGWVIFVCSIAQFVLQHIYKVSWHWTVWLVSWVVIAYQIYYLRNKRKHRTVKTYTDSIIGVVWLAFAITLILVVAVLGNIFQSKGINFFIMVNPILLVLYGIPSFISGFILKFRPLWIGGISCWVLSIISALLPADYQVLMLAPAMMFAWILPGYLLRARHHKTISE